MDQSDPEEIALNGQNDDLAEQNLGPNDLLTDTLSEPQIAQNDIQNKQNASPILPRMLSDETDEFEINESYGQDQIYNETLVIENGEDDYTTKGEANLLEAAKENNRKSAELEETVHITAECQRLDMAIATDVAYMQEPMGANDDTVKFVQKYFGQMLELPQLLLNKSQLDITALIEFSRELAKFPPPLKSRLGDIFPIETFTLLKSFLENLGLNLQQCIWSLVIEDLPADKFNELVNVVIQNYCETLCPNYKIWNTFSKQKMYDIVLETDYIKVLTKGPVLFADFYGRVFEDLVANIRDNKLKTDLQNMIEDYISKSKRKKSIKADLAATWQMIVQFLLLFKGAQSSLKKISPEVVSEESLKCVQNVCSYFEVFTELTNLISALSLGFKTSECMIDHIKGWSPEQTSEMSKKSRAFIQSIHPRDVEFYPVPKRNDKIRDSKATLYLFSDKLIVKISKDGFSSQFLRGLGYHLPDITIYNLQDVKGFKFEKASEHIMEQYSIPDNLPPPMVLTLEIENAKTMEIVFKTGPDVSDQDKQSTQFSNFLERLKDINRLELLNKCTTLTAPANLELLNEIARSWMRVRELEKVPEPILHENPGLLGEISLDKFQTVEKIGARSKTVELGRKGIKGCKSLRMLIFTDSIFVHLIGQINGVNNYTIWQHDVTKFTCDFQGKLVLISIESEKLKKNFRLYPEIPKGPAGIENKVVKDIKHYINCFNEIKDLRLTEEQKLKELHVHAKDPELKANKR